MFGRSFGEYLGLLYYHGTAKGYLARALINMVLKEVQSPIYQDPAEMRLLQSSTSWDH